MFVCALIYTCICRYGFIPEIMYCIHTFTRIFSKALSKLNAFAVRKRMVLPGSVLKWKWERANFLHNSRHNQRRINIVQGRQRRQKHAFMWNWSCLRISLLKSLTYSSSTKKWGKVTSLSFSFPVQWQKSSLNWFYYRVAILFWNKKCCLSHWPSAPKHENTQTNQPSWKNVHNYCDKPPFFPGQGPAFWR